MVGFWMKFGFFRLQHRKLRRVWSNLLFARINPRQWLVLTSQAVQVQPAHSGSTILVHTPKPSPAPIVSSSSWQVMMAANILSALTFRCKWQTIGGHKDPLKTGFTCFILDSSCFKAIPTRSYHKQSNGCLMRCQACGQFAAQWSRRIQCKMRGDLSQALIAKETQFVIILETNWSKGICRTCSDHCVEHEIPCWPYT